MIFSRSLATTTVAAAALLAESARAQDAAPDPGAATVLENARILPASGPEIPRGSLVIRGGRIVAVGASVEAPDGARRLDLAGRTVCPGFVDAASRCGLAGSDRSQGARDVEAETSDGADLGADAVAAARRAGVTSLVLSPGGPRGAFVGRLALVKTAAGAGLEGRVADRRGALKAVLSAPVRGPSLGCAEAAARVRAALRGAVEYAEAREKHRKDLADFLKECAKSAGGDALEESLLPPAVAERLRRLDPEPREAARKALRARLGLKDPEKAPKPAKRPAEPKEDPAREALLAATRGQVPVRFEAQSVEDVRAALALAAEFGLKASVEGGLEAGRAAADLAAAKVPVAVWPAAGPGAEEDGPPASAVPATLAAAGVRVAVATGGSEPLAARNLPLLASLAAGQGLDRAAALRAVTLDAAAAAGFEGRIGSLEPGKDADFAVLDGDPLAPGTRVLAVWIEGVEQPAPPDGGR